MRFHTHALRRSIGSAELSVHEVQPRIGAQVKTLACPANIAANEFCATLELRKIAACGSRRLSRAILFGS